MPLSQPVSPHTGSDHLALNPHLDRKAIARTLKENGRVSIPDILVASHAERLTQALEQETPWGFTYFDGKDACFIDPPLLKNLPRATWDNLIRSIHQQARTHFSYAYDLYPIQESARLGRDRHLFLHMFFAFLNGPIMLDFIRDILDDPTIQSADAQATRFGPAHYLSQHNDEVKGSGRRCAYVFNCTRAWRPDWGGYLQFFDEAGAGLTAFQPGYNTLNIFLVPQLHAVSYVPPFAGGYRYAVSGWFRTTAPTAIAS